METYSLKVWLELDSIHSFLTVNSLLTLNIVHSWSWSCRMMQQWKALLRCFFCAVLEYWKIFHFLAMWKLLYYPRLFENNTQTTRNIHLHTTYIENKWKESVPLVSLCGPVWWMNVFNAKLGLKKVVKKNEQSWSYSRPDFSIQVILSLFNTKIRQPRRWSEAWETFLLVVLDQKEHHTQKLITSRLWCWFERNEHVLIIPLVLFHSLYFIFSFHYQPEVNSAVRMLPLYRV